MSIVILSAAFNLWALNAQAEAKCSPNGMSESLLGVDPFPLDCPLPFPWTSIEGNWELKGAGVYTAYSFEARNSCEGRKILRIRQFNVITGQVLSEGVGYEEQNSKNVRAIMKSATGSHLLYVGRYLNKEEKPPKPANVLRVVPIENPDAGKGWEILQIDFNIRVGSGPRQSELTCIDDSESL